MEPFLCSASFLVVPFRDVGREVADGRSFVGEVEAGPAVVDAVSAVFGCCGCAFARLPSDDDFSWPELVPVGARFGVWSGLPVGVVGSGMGLVYPNGCAIARPSVQVSAFRQPQGVNF